MAKDYKTLKSFRNSVLGAVYTPLYKVKKGSVKSSSVHFLCQLSSAKVSGIQKLKKETSITV
jgi:hypothetical protein